MIVHVSLSASLRQW